MAGRTHVWLLLPAGPAHGEAPAAWLARHLADPDEVQPPELLAPLRGLWAWWRRWRGTPVVEAACADTPEALLRLEPAELLARDLGRVLGPHYAPRLLRDHPAAAAAAREVKSADRVVLLPLCPQVGGPTTIGPLRKAHAALAEHPAARADLPGYPDDADYVDVLCDSLRAALLERPDGAPPWELLIVGRGWHGRADAYADQVVATASAVLSRLGLARAWYPAFLPAPGAARAPTPALEEVVVERAAAGVRALVVLPVGFPLPDAASHPHLGPALRERAAAAGIESLVVAAPAARTAGWLHMAAAQVREAETRAGWEVPWSHALAEGVAAGLAPAPTPAPSEGEE